MKPYFSVSRPHILAHRGLHTIAVENTLSAFALALAAGATHIETDAHASRDGVAVLVHDPVVMVDGVPVTVSTLTANELAELDLGGGEGIPSLAEALSKFPDARFNIDIKATEAAAGVVSAVAEAQARHRVLIASFKAARRTSAARKLPSVATSASATISLLSVLCSTLGLTWFGRRLLQHIDAVQLPVSMVGLPVFTPRFIEMCHRAGVVVHAWTINNPRDMQMLLDAGVDGIVTDRCDLAQAVRPAVSR